MIDVYFGRENVPEGRMMLDPRPWFTTYKKPEWFEDEFVKRFLKDVDKTEVLFEEALKNRWGRGISTEMISTGCKALCLLKFYVPGTGKILYGSAMGDNCVKYYIELGKMSDFALFYEHYPMTLDEFFVPGLMRHDGVLLNHIFDFDDCYSDWCIACEELRRQEYEFSE